MFKNASKLTISFLFKKQMLRKGQSLLSMKCISFVDIQKKGDKKEGKFFSSS